MSSYNERQLYLKFSDCLRWTRLGFTSYITARPQRSNFLLLYNCWRVGPSRRHRLTVNSDHVATLDTRAYSNITFTLMPIYKDYHTNTLPIYTALYTSIYWISYTQIIRFLPSNSGIYGC